MDPTPPFCRVCAEFCSEFVRGGGGYVTSLYRTVAGDEFSGTCERKETKGVKSDKKEHSKEGRRRQEGCIPCEVASFVPTLRTVRSCVAIRSARASFVIFSFFFKMFRWEASSSSCFFWCLVRRRRCRTRSSRRALTAGASGAGSAARFISAFTCIVVCSYR